MLLIYTEKITSRLEYIFDFIFNEILGINFEITENKNSFIENKNHQKINYSKKEFSNILFLYSKNLLFEKEIKNQNFKKFFFEKNGVFWKKSFFHFDIFAASFYLISRYEEYLPFEKDIHNRYSAKNSTAYKNNFLQKPIINIWANEFFEKLKLYFPNLKKKKIHFEYICTIDVDNAYAYLNKKFFLIFGSFFKSFLKFDFNNNFQRFKTIFGFQKDKFDNFDYLENLRKKYNLKIIYFFLFGKYKKFDRNISIRNKTFQKLIKNLEKNNEIGIHPTYFSNEKKEILNEEILNLSKLIKKKITKSRQHYLKLEFPKTYENLEKFGIKEDYTMGYADEIGFRASTSTAFYFYNLYKEKRSNLKIYSFAFMEVSLKNYLKYSPNFSKKKIYEMILYVKKYGGTFISLWHNESLSDKYEWKNWRNVLEETIKFINKK